MIRFVINEVDTFHSNSLQRFIARRFYQFHQKMRETQKPLVSWYWLVRPRTKSKRWFREFSSHCPRIPCFTPSEIYLNRRVLSQSTSLSSSRCCRSSRGQYATESLPVEMPSVSFCTADAASSVSFLLSIAPLRQTRLLVYRFRY